MKILPVVCTLTPETIATRKANLLPGLFLRPQFLEWLPNGVRAMFDLSIASLPEIASTIDAERRCCRFLQFEVSLEPDEGPVSLRITGPEGTREFLDALLSA
jgi:hypothetical protein